MRTVDTTAARGFGRRVSEDVWQNSGFYTREEEHTPEPGSHSSSAHTPEETERRTYFARNRDPGFFELRVFPSFSELFRPGDVHWLNFPNFLDTTISLAKVSELSQLPPGLYSTSIGLRKSDSSRPQINMEHIRASPTCVRICKSA